MQRDRKITKLKNAKNFVLDAFQEIVHILNLSESFFIYVPSSLSDSDIKVTPLFIKMGKSSCGVNS